MVANIALITMLHARDANEAHYKINYLDILNWLQTVNNLQTWLQGHHKEDSVAIAGWVECWYRQPKLADFWQCVAKVHTRQDSIVSTSLQLIPQ